MVIPSDFYLRNEAVLCISRLQAPASGNLHSPKIHENCLDCTLLCVSKLTECSVIGYSPAHWKAVPDFERRGGGGVESAGGSLSHESLD